MKYALLLILCIAVSCKKNNFEIGKNVFSVEKNLSYGSHPAEKLDLYIPKNAEKISGLILIIHGGGWRGGDKSNFTFFTKSLMQKLPHFAYANMNYILADESNYAVPTQIENIASAIKFLKLHSRKFNIGNNFVLLGNSAGAHLSMLYDSHFDRDNSVKAVINIVGPVNLSDPHFRNYSDYAFVEKHLVNPSVIKEISKMEYASPIFWISPKSSPVLSFYGNSDGVIPLSQKKSLDSALNIHQIQNESYEFSGGHEDWRKENNEKFLLEKISNFLSSID